MGFFFSSTKEILNLTDHNEKTTRTTVEMGNIAFENRIPIRKAMMTNHQKTFKKLLLSVNITIYSNSYDKRTLVS